MKNSPYMCDYNKNLKRYAIPTIQQELSSKRL